MQENTEQPFEPVACGHMADGGCCLRCANEQRKARQLFEAAERATELSTTTVCLPDLGFSESEAGVFGAGVGHGIGWLIYKLGAAGISSVAILNAIEAPDAK